MMFTSDRALEGSENDASDGKGRSSIQERMNKGCSETVNNQKNTNPRHRFGYGLKESKKKRNAKDKGC